ncbi:siderophore-interacting protein [Herbiconiux sp. CPCC 205716]|uniref:Siderophore-interacting protein n=1 Tax=Herbiconiux gentiana TaxID=2970912 RepID=A0ABT2GAK1_9MICO|nr:siderophore-interacting protein [Herbiconiux gentiana]MCS5713151.1 siderophore-interacting protein [Herbiconiux gentiana]
MTTTLTVTGTTWVTPTIRRVHLHSADLSAFAESVFTDRYVKLIFPRPGVNYPDPIDVRALRGTMPPEQLPEVRTYTALSPDVDAGTMAIDFVVHGDEGVAGRWAARAREGDGLMVSGPGGAYRPDPDADWHLLVGDESALPAVLAALDALDTDAAVSLVALVESPEHEPAIARRRNVDVRFVHRSTTPGPGALEAAVRAVPWRDGIVQAFVHGEADEVMHRIRPYLKNERGLPRERLSISGYWREGRTEEGFRAWKSELAAAERS